jgi:squalene-hopene/tetraprenyl-beta-curcumene cyclase
MIENGRKWLSNSQNQDGGWGGDKNAPSTIEETALATHALAGITDDDTTVDRAVEWLINHAHQGTKFPPSPIGLYFARLWYSEKLYPLIFTTEALAACKKSKAK